MRKESNYKFHLLSLCKNLNKIDGIKVTKIDREMAFEFAKMIDEHFDLVPSSRPIDLLSKDRPSTAVSEFEIENLQTGPKKSVEELEKEIAKLEKIIRQTE